jgi:hypothetical protein
LRASLPTALTLPLAALARALAAAPLSAWPLATLPVSAPT